MLGRPRNACPREAGQLGAKWCAGRHAKSIALRTARPPWAVPGQGRRLHDTSAFPDPSSTGPIPCGQLGRAAALGVGSS